MSMWPVSLYDTIDTPLHTPTHTRLLKHTPPCNRLWALVFKKGTDNQHFHFRLSSGGHPHREASPQAKQLPRTPPYFWRRPLDVTLRVRETTNTDDCDVISCRMTLTTITITKFNGTNCAQWATEMAQLLEQKEVYGIIKGYDYKPEEPAANAKATEKAAFNDWMNRHGVARWTILLGMEPRIQAEYMVVDDAKTLWEKLASAYKSQLKLNIFEIREDLWSIKLQDCGDIDIYTLQIDRKVKDYNLWAGPTTTDTDATDTDASAKTIAKMSEQKHIFYLLRGIARNDEWKVFLELTMEKNATMTAMPNEIVTKLIEKEAAIKSENRLAPEPPLFAKKGGKGGRGGKVGKSPKRDKRDNKDDRKQMDFQMCCHCQRRGHTTENCLSKQRGGPPKAADNATKASTEALATSTLTMSFENFWMVGSSSASSSDWFIDCRWTTHISGRWSMFITYTKYPPNTKKVKGYNRVTSFASGYGSVRMICQLPDGRTETIIL